MNVEICVTESPNKTLHEPECRLCRAPSPLKAFELESVPHSVETLIHSSFLDEDMGQSLNIYQCAVCGFVQLHQSMHDDFYDEYEMATSFSSSFNNYLAQLATSFVEFFDISTGHIVEVGCGDGTFMEHLARHGFNVTGVEPSRPFREAAREKGFVVIASYVEEGEPLVDRPFDAFVTRQVLEHVENIYGFLRGLRTLIVPGAPGLVEVPNLDKAIEDGRFYDFFPDHVNYFSESTLSLALSANGFDVSAIHPTMDGEFITAFVRRRDAPSLQPIQQAVESVRSSLSEFVNLHQRTGKHLAIWGSGGKGITLLAIMGAEGIDYVVDADPRKHGLFMPICHLQIHPPDMLKKNPVDTVLITALAHKDEIVDQLRMDIGFQGRIALLGTSIQYID